MSKRSYAALFLFPALLALSTVGAAPAELPLLVKEDFSKGAERWAPTDPKAWKVIDAKEGKAFSQFQQSKYSPPHRSPLNFALLKDVVVGDFLLEAKVQSTVKEYGHRDMCIIFGHQDPSHFYYVHFGSKTDDRANQIFLVNDAPRAKISTQTTPGTKWSDGWHEVKVIRKVDDGTIEVYFDDMKTPAMKAVDKTFAWGRIGFGTFDDTGNITDVRLRGVKVEKK